MPTSDRSALADPKPLAPSVVSSGRPPRLASLQAVRAVAALSIVALHSVQEAEALSREARLAFRALPLPLAAGVDAFFILSSFLLVAQLTQPTTQRPSPGKFLFRRVVRVVPLYWAVTTAYLFAFLIAPGSLNSHPPTFLYAIASYLFVPFVNQEWANEPVYKLGWSLNCEMFFYLTLAFLSRLSPLRIVIGLTVTISTLVMARAAAGIDAGAALSLWGNPLMLDFIWGAWLGWAYSAGYRLTVSVASILVTGGIFALLAGSLGSWEPTWAVRSIQWGLPCAACVAGLGLSRFTLQKNLGRVGRAAVLLGDASYALYLVHPFVIRLCKEGWQHRFSTTSVNLFAFIVWATASAAVVALLVFRYLERPFLHWARARVKT